MKLVVVALVSLLVQASAVGAASIYDEKKGSSYSTAAPEEIMQLPKYCWGHYNKKFKGPKYNINKQSCGPYMNHFCPGILRFNRSQNPMAGKGERQTYLKHSLRNFEYTIKGMKEYPACYIRKHALMMYKRASMARSMPMP